MALTIPTVKHHTLRNGNPTRSPFRINHPPHSTDHPQCKTVPLLDTVRSDGIDKSNRKASQILHNGGPMPPCNHPPHPRSTLLPRPFHGQIHHSVAITQNSGNSPHQNNSNFLLFPALFRCFFRRYFGACISHNHNDPTAPNACDSGTMAT
jgi:hypothetical protein